MRCWTQAFIRDRRIECREVDGPYRLRAKHERIVPLAFAVDSCLCCKTTNAIEARLGFLVDAAIEEMDRRQVARILERLPHRESASGPAVVVLGCPIVPGAAATGR